jgi:hypothetical protein
MDESVRSLNLANAVSIVLYEGLGTTGHAARDAWYSSLRGGEADEAIG